MRLRKTFLFSVEPHQKDRIIIKGTEVKHSQNREMRRSCIAKEKKEKEILPYPESNRGLCLPSA